MKYFVSVIMIVLFIFSGCSNGTTDKVVPDVYIDWEPDGNGFTRFSDNDTGDYEYDFWDFKQNANIQANTYEIECKKISGASTAGYGMIFGSENSYYSRNFYALIISTDGRYSVLKATAFGYFGVNYTTIKDWEYSSSINKGYNAINTLKVVQAGLTSSVYLNGTNVCNLNSITLFGSWIGYFVRILDKDVEKFPGTPVDVRFRLINQAPPLNLSINNQTGYTIYYVYTPLSSDSDWGPDMLTGVLSNGHSTTVQLPLAGAYNIQLKDSQDNTYTKWDVVIDSDTALTFTYSDIDEYTEHGIWYMGSGSGLDSSSSDQEFADALNEAIHAYNEDNPSALEDTIVFNGVTYTEQNWQSITGNVPQYVNDAFWSDLFKNDYSIGSCWLFNYAETFSKDGTGTIYIIQAIVSDPEAVTVRAYNFKADLSRVESESILESRSISGLKKATKTQSVSPGENVPGQNLEHQIMKQPNRQATR